MDDWEVKFSSAMILIQAGIGKPYRYLAFVESGEILESYPDTKDRPIEFKVVFQFPPHIGGQALIAKVRPIVPSAGFILRDEVFTGA